MLQKYIDILERHKHFYDFYMKTGEIVNFNIDVQNELLYVYRAYKDPYYHLNRSCPVCISEFLKSVYSLYETNTPE